MGLQGSSETVKKLEIAIFATHLISFSDAIMYTIMGVCFLAAFLFIAKEHLVDCAGHCKKIEHRNVKIQAAVNKTSASV